MALSMEPDVESIGWEGLETKFHVISSFCVNCSLQTNISHSESYIIVINISVTLS